MKFTILLTISLLIIATESSKTNFGRKQSWYAPRSPASLNPSQPIWELFDEKTRDTFNRIPDKIDRPDGMKVWNSGNIIRNEIIPNDYNTIFGGNSYEPFNYQNPFLIFNRPRAILARQRPAFAPPSYLHVRQPQISYSPNIYTFPQQLSAPTLYEIPSRSQMPLMPSMPMPMPLMPTMPQMPIPMLTNMEDEIRKFTASLSSVGTSGFDNRVKVNVLKQKSESDLNKPASAPVVAQADPNKSLTKPDLPASENRYSGVKQPRPNYSALERRFRAKSFAATENEKRPPMRPVKNDDPQMWMINELRKLNFGLKQ